MTAAPLLEVFRGNEGRVADQGSTKRDSDGDSLDSTDSSSRKSSSGSDLTGTPLIGPLKNDSDACVEEVVLAMANHPGADTGSRKTKKSSRIKKNNDSKKDKLDLAVSGASRLFSYKDEF